MNELMTGLNPKADDRLAAKIGATVTDRPSAWKGDFHTNDFGGPPMTTEEARIEEGLSYARTQLIRFANEKFCDVEHQDIFKEFMRFHTELASITPGEVMAARAVDAETREMLKAVSL